LAVKQNKAAYPISYDVCVGLYGTSWLSTVQMHCASRLLTSLKFIGKS
jgi:hypothetical protein